MKDNRLKLLRQQEPTFLFRAKKRGYVCPSCGSGSGENGTGITKDPNCEAEHPRWKCFNCGDYQDAVGWWQIQHHEESFNNACSDMEKHYGLTSEPVSDKKPLTPSRKRKSETTTKTQPSHRGYIEACQKRIHDPMAIASLKERGISTDTAEFMGWGYDPEYDLSAGKWQGENPPTMQALIIPNDGGGYTARNVQKDCEQANKSRKAKPNTFTGASAALDATRPIFVCEGEFDYASFCELAYDAICIGGTGGIGQLIDFLTDNKPTQPLILALDADKAGKDATASLAKHCDSIGVTYHVADVTRLYNGKKDANEALCANRETFERNARIVTQTPAEEYRDSYTGGRIDAFVREVMSNDRDVRIATGLEKLDRVLGGGLKPGLYFLGAATGFGKTTLTLQIADNIAASGRDVLFFSIEMGEFELISKSLSRMTYEQSRSKDLATSADGILEGWRYQNYSQQRKDAIQAALDKYTVGTGRHLKVNPCHGKPTIEDIRKAIEKHISFTGNHPLVIIDYVQLVRPRDKTLSEKMNMDEVSWTLRRLGRELKSPIICISSLNRASYTKLKPLSLSDFKESGGLEYNADVALVVEFADVEAMAKDEEKAEEERLANPRRVRVKTLKNRSGNIHDVTMKFYRNYGYFEEAN